MAPRAAARRAACLAVILAAASALDSSEASERAIEELAADDECSAAGGADDQAHCALSALQRRGARAAAVRAHAHGATKTPCGDLDAAENDICRSTVTWAATGGGKWDPDAHTWFEQMKEISGVDYKEATLEDFQRLYYCSPPGGKACGTPPCGCSKPPCGQCFGGAGPKPTRPGCAGNSTSIKCKPPARPMSYKGMAWPPMSFAGTEEAHLFAIGDWGGMDGSLNPVEGRPPIVAYRGGNRQGPSVFPRTRWNKYHTRELCTHSQFIECFNSGGAPPCARSCGFVPGVDDQPQLLVAAALQARAAAVAPRAILNVGDNFYWGGIEKQCGTPMDEISYTAHHQFNQVFEGVYTGPGLDGVPWLSVLGNHDWGGRVFNNGWDQQIAYTWASARWVMPAPYFSTLLEWPDQGLSVEVFMVDSNFVDAKPPPLDSEHNICGSAHNPPDADCAVADGPASVASCPAFFRALWREQQAWLQRKIAGSTANWQIVVTHFPCGHEQAFYYGLHMMGLDLLVTGHRHDQELWLPTDYTRNLMGGLTCMVTGGGGGITSEATPDPMNKVDWYGENQYGFYDLAITKHSIRIESVDHTGLVTKRATVYPVR